MSRRLYGKLLGFVGYAVQYGCIAHCTFEYVGELVAVPRGHVWLEGDNLQNSTDSRSYGPVPYGLIRGRVCFKLWPPHSVGTLDDSPHAGRIQRTE
ncbi:Mitochondrial inner membrane protease subunit 1 [Bagarius yarrelli]|uniref:Mitochondrial inner membrane protease subunit 1 n=1 Tax=Bagarius yarrelli TaxID=175774 RepID=A0A556U325_BAGYA|nr:Mitochondrial inner membrane protease subunit 1 [Bagarius yarrelli]